MLYSMLARPKRCVKLSLFEMQMGPPAKKSKGAPPPVLKAFEDDEDD